MTNRTKLIN